MRYRVLGPLEVETDDGPVTLGGLRRALEPARARGAAGEVLVTREPGYLLRVAPGALDAPGSRS